jgi:uncharacterized YigZ family protein
MKTISNNAVNEYLINKSKFITVIKHVDNINNVKDLIDDVKKEYEGATHYCYAYIIDNYKKASDDGEPIKTAGLPILNVLEKEHLNHILCIVIRYYGGIKLGAPGLIRAYTKAVTNCLELANIKEEHLGLEITITFNYNNIKTIDYLIRNAKLKTSSFDEEVTYIFNIDINEFNNIKAELQMFINTLYKKENVFI